jgi:formate hydrogenlyase subunit 6/NADH:ubiquinone oxidoreductase subunit I
MKKIKNRLSMLTAIIDALRTPPETVDYPLGELDLPEGFRGAIIIDPDKCIGCGLCVRDCPAEALELNKKSRENFTLIHYPARCAYCGQCEISCRHGAISNSNKLVGSTNSQEGLIVVLKQNEEED